MNVRVHAGAFHATDRGPHKSRALITILAVPSSALKGSIQSYVGTDNGMVDGSLDAYGDIVGIVLAADDQAVNYDFAGTNIMD